MANYIREFGTPTRVTTSALGTIGGGKNLSLIGIRVGAVLTSQTVNLYVGADTTAVNLVGTSTMAANTYHQIPAYCAGGLTFRVTNEDVDLTIFWNPEHGN